VNLPILTAFKSVDTRTGIRSRSDRSATSGAFPARCSCKSATPGRSFIRVAPSHARRLGTSATAAPLVELASSSPRPSGQKSVDCVGALVQATSHRTTSQRQPTCMLKGIARTISDLRSWDCDTGTA
jgi:hypothetical protein